ncbi:glycosyltransferase [Acinetobacter johnsonii]|uniref:glycosyltransferase n=1 Tax=Acinetobacter johnsonii TaxID=40214 RepID=UPI003F55B975
MKIALHFPKLSSGGVEKIQIILAKEFLSRNIDVDFVLCQAQGEYLSQVPEKVNIIDFKVNHTRNSLFPLVNYLKKHQPDYLISSLGPQNVMAIIACKLAKTKTKVFVTQHNALSQQAKQKATIQQRLIPFCYKLVLPYADGVISVSKGIAEDIAENVGYPLSKVHVIYNPAYVEKKEHVDNRVINELIKDKKYIISIGRLVHQKAFDDLINAFKKVYINKPEMHLVILGNGPLEASLKKQAYQLGLQDVVHFLGFVENPNEYLAKASLFTLASRYEGFGNVIVEALSEGIPVVCTDCEYGPNEILEDGKYGILVPVGDIDALANGILHTLNSQYNPEFLIERAKNFSPSSVAEEYLSVIRI